MAARRCRPPGVRPRDRAGLRPALSSAAGQVLESLNRRGASFLADIVKDTRQLTSEVEDALWELAAAGLVTADGFENLRALDRSETAAGDREASHPASALRARPLGAVTPVPGSDPGTGGVRPQAGKRAAPGGQNELTVATLEAIARQLLLRWGVVFRDLLARETMTPAWRDLLMTFRRMEAQGEIRGGRFVSGFVGEQFARPEAVELLREIRRDQNVGAAPHVSAADPLNLGGIITPGSRVSPLSGLVVPLVGRYGIRSASGEFQRCNPSGFIKPLV